VYQIDDFPGCALLIGHASQDRPNFFQFFLDALHDINIPCVRHDREV
jgi:hypothetical protein